LGEYEGAEYEFPNESRYPARFRSEYLRDELGIGEDLRYEVACLAFKPSGAVEFAGHWMRRWDFFNHTSYPRFVNAQALQVAFIRLWKTGKMFLRNPPILRGRS
jgi:hypothetical protein